MLTTSVNSLKFVKIVNDKYGVVTGIEAYGKDEWKADVKAGLESIYGHAYMLSEMTAQ